MLRIFNSLIGEKQIFKPIRPDQVSMYVCGITAYDFCHMGHARVMIVFDMVARYLNSLGLNVKYVRNITDIDDKIIQRARDNSEDVSALTARFISAMHKDISLLGVRPPSIEPRATEHISQILDMIQILLDKKYAYIAENNDVFYDVSAFDGYGQLSGKRADQLRAGERVQINQAKDDPLDFVLWKSSKLGEPSWDSPWGPGRPGWHIECSAMSTHCLGGHFDIHGGGQDLQFPHHENEIAQSQAATGEDFANVWMHNGFVNIDGEKMSKSEDNFFTVREVLKAYHPQVVRFFILSSHYRSPLNYSLNNLDQAKAALKSLYIALRGIRIDNVDVNADYAAEFNRKMDDDFNTPEAIALLHELAHGINRSRDKQPQQARILAATLKRLADTLGLLPDPPEYFLQRSYDSEDSQLTDKEIIRLVSQREQARKNKDFSESDRIRDLLAFRGVILEDTHSGTTWQRS